MICRLLFIFLVLIPGSLLAQLPKPSYIAFKPGEELNYTIHYGLIHAAKIRLQVDNKIKHLGNESQYYFYAQGITNSGWDYFFKVRDYYYSFVDTTTLLPVSAIRNVLEGDYSKTENFIFNRKGGVVISQNTEHKASSDVMDLLAAVYYARCIDYDRIPLNKEIHFNTFFENDLFPVGLTFEGKTVLNTKFGKIRCVVLRPRLVEGRVFKGQKDMTIYISDDKNHIPVKIRTAIFVGYVEADLNSYQHLKYPLVFLDK